MKTKEKVVFRVYATLAVGTEISFGDFKTSTQARKAVLKLSKINNFYTKYFVQRIKTKTIFEIKT